MCFGGVWYQQVKLPAEPEDWIKRPAYITENSVSVPICENRYVIAFYFVSYLTTGWTGERLQYLVVKGAILRKG